MYLKNVVRKKFKFSTFEKNAFRLIFDLEEAIFLLKNSLFKNTFIPKILLRNNTKHTLKPILKFDCCYIIINLSITYGTKFYTKIILSITYSLKFDCTKIESINF